MIKILENFVDKFCECSILTYTYILLGVSLLIFLYYIGILRRVTFENQVWGPRTLVYKEYQGLYKDIGPSFGELMKSNLDDQSKPIFKFSHSFGHFYDHPNKLVNPQDCRALLGWVVNPGQTSKIQTYLQKNPQYKIVNIPVLNSIVHYFQYRSILGRLNFTIFVIKAYPALTKYLQKNQLNENTFQGIMEEYVLLNNNSHVTLRAFNDPNSQIFNLSTFPAPRRKNE